MGANQSKSQTPVVREQNGRKRLTKWRSANSASVVSARGAHPTESLSGKRQASSFSDTQRLGDLRYNRSLPQLRNDDQNKHQLGYSDTALRYPPPLDSPPRRPSLAPVMNSQTPRPKSANSPPPPSVPQASALEKHNARVRQENSGVDTQTGERADFTMIWHSLAHRTSWSTLASVIEAVPTDQRPPGEALVASLSTELWQLIASFLSAADAASLAIASRTLQSRLGDRPLVKLGLPENLHDRVRFLLHLEEKFPGQLICYSCGAFHRRTHPGAERLQPSIVLNPLVLCPSASDPTVRVPRARLVPGHSLPFAFAQLAIRHTRLGGSYGVPASTLGRKWTDQDSGWSHSTSFFVDPRSRHLLMRVTSSTPAAPDLPPAGMRHLIFDKAEYEPHFSVCAHWRDGELVPLTKCALDHIPGGGPNLAHRVAHRARGEFVQGLTGVQIEPNPVSMKQIIIGGGTGPAGQCAMCRPMRRCPECPTEYLIELRLVEDKRRAGNDAALYDANHPLASLQAKPVYGTKAGMPRMVHALSVTRWSDLGDGLTPFDGEWAACVGAEDATRYDSFARVGGRTVAGTFEARFGDSNSGQRILNLNPKGEKRGIEGHRWY